jgi:hypothetical protein
VHELIYWHAVFIQSMKKSQNSMKQDSTYELRDVLHQKNDLIINQTRRIKLLEDKLMEVQQKYFKLKVAMQMFK